jgi:hypothetical protein
MDESDERARVILERRREGVPAPPSGADEPASGGPRAEVKGLVKSCERGLEDGRGVCTAAGTLSLSPAGGDGVGCSAGAHDAGRSLLRGRDGESGEPRELAWPILEGRPAK